MVIEAQRLFPGNRIRVHNAEVKVTAVAVYPEAVMIVGEECGFQRCYIAQPSARIRMATAADRPLPALVS